jgi:hypothetical protein
MTCSICQATDHGNHVGQFDWPAHFKAAFIQPTTGEPYDVPADLRTAAERICQSYGIRGICDPMWIANVIARETGRGDGVSNFHEADSA